jgi:hypothetical protein
VRVLGDMSASYRVSKADMEASRLVFVMLKDAKPMRKVAIPIMEGMSFGAFEGQVRALLVQFPRSFDTHTYVRRTSYDPDAVYQNLMKQPMHCNGCNRCCKARWHRAGQGQAAHPRNTKHDIGDGAHARRPSTQ